MSEAISEKVAALRSAFAQRLRVALAASEKSRGEVAAACSVSRAAVHKWTSGVCFPTSHNLMVISELTGASLEWLMWPYEVDIRSTQYAPDGKHIKDLMREVVREYFASVAGPDA